MTCGTATGSCVRGALLNNDTHMPEDCSGSRGLQRVVVVDATGAQIASESEVTLTAGRSGQSVREE
jgi:hypothetical protein